MQYCIYLRKSRADLDAEARGEGETLARHKRTLLALAKKSGYAVTKIYQELVSGDTIASRPVMQQLLSEVEQNVWDGVLVVEIERLARGDTIDQGIVAQTFKYSNTLIITPTKIYDPNDEYDQEYFEFTLFMSRREYNTIKRRMQGGRMDAFKEGNYIGGRVPYGYDRKNLPERGQVMLVPNDEEREIVQLMFRLYTAGEPDQNGDPCRLGTSRIASRLREMGVPTKRGGRWDAETVREILCNPVYIGKQRWNYRRRKKSMVNGTLITTRTRDLHDCLIADGRHDPIIDEDTFRLAQEYLAKNKPIPNNRILQNPLAGLVYCGKCGMKMQRARMGGAFYYSLMCRGDHCDCRSAKIEIIEAKVMSSLSEWLTSYKMRIKNSIKDHSESDEIKRLIASLQSRVDTTSAQISKAYDLLEQGIYTTEVFLSRNTSLCSRMDHLKQEIDRLQQRKSELDSFRAGRQEIIPRVEKLLDMYDTLDTAQAKNNMLKQVLVKIEYTKEPSAAPEDFNIKIFPKIPENQ